MPDKPRSNQKLEQFLAECPAEDLHGLILLLRSGFSPESQHLAKRVPHPGYIHARGTSARHQLAERVVLLLTWYGSNTLSYGWRAITREYGGNSYQAILRDTAKILNKELKKKNRVEIRRGFSVADLEQAIVEIFFHIQFDGKNSEDIEEVLQEAGASAEVAKQVAWQHGPAALAGASLPVLVRLLGKKTVMKMVQKMLVSVASRHIGKEAAKEMAIRMGVKYTQKSLAKFVSGIGWVLLASEVAVFATSPARRVTCKAVPYISLIRMRGRLDQTQ